MSTEQLRSGPRELWLPVTDSMRLYVRDYSPRGPSSGVPVVCLHGYWRTSRDFEELADHLTASRRVVLVDLRGRGQSDRSSDVADYAFERLVDDVKLLHSALRTGPFVIAGTALGAQIGMWLAANEPGLIAGLVLNDSGPESSSGTNKTMAAFSGGEECTFEEAVDRVRRQYEPQCPRFGAEDWVRMMLRAYRRLDTGAYVRDFDQLTNVDLVRVKKLFPTFWGEYEKIGVPMALLRGENSGFMTAEIAQRMVERNPNLQLTTIPGVGHPVFLYEPEAFTAIDALLARVDARHAG